MRSSTLSILYSLSVTVSALVINATDLLDRREDSSEHVLLCNCLCRGLGWSDVAYVSLLSSKSDTHPLKPCSTLVLYLAARKPRSSPPPIAKAQPSGRATSNPSPSLTATSLPGTSQVQYPLALRPAQQTQIKAHSTATTNGTSSPMLPLLALHALSFTTATTTPRRPQSQETSPKSTIT